MSAKNILILKGNSRYNVLKKAADEIAVGFKKCGYNVTVCDISENGNSDEFIFREENYCFVFCFQALFACPETEEQKRLLTDTHIPLIGWVVDDLNHHLSRVKNIIYPSAYMLTVDLAMPDIAKSRYPDVNHIFTLFHGGFMPPETHPEKDIDILFPGTISSEPHWPETPLPIEEQIANRALDILHQKPYLSVHTVIYEILSELGEEASPEILLELSMVIAYVSDQYRYQCRYQLMETLLKNHIKLHIVGEGYHDFFQKYSDDIILHGACDIGKTLELMSKAKIIINPVPPVFEKGFHERIFTAMLCHAACFSPFFHYGKETLGNRIEWIDMCNIHEMIPRLQEILSDYDTYTKTVLNDNYNYALENHTWEKRGMQIIDFYEHNCDPNELKIF